MTQPNYLVETVILNGLVEYIEYEDENHRDRHIGITEYDTVPTFEGYVSKASNKFPFSPKMDEKLWYDVSEVKVKVVFSDAPIDPQTVASDDIISYCGDLNLVYDVRNYGGEEGYIGTDEKFEVDGHDIVQLLKDHNLEYCHLEIYIYD